MDPTDNNRDICQVDVGGKLENEVRLHLSTERRITSYFLK